MLTLATAALLNGVADPYALSRPSCRAPARCCRRRTGCSTGASPTPTSWPRLLRGGALVALASSATAATLAGEGLSVTTTLPREGTTGWFESWQLTSRTRHPVCAYRWLNLVTAPEAQAAVAHDGLGPASGEACDLPGPGRCQRLGLATPEVIGRVAFARTPDPAHGVRGVAPRLGRMLRAVTRRRTTAAVLAAAPAPGARRAARTRSPGRTTTRCPSGSGSSPPAARSPLTFAVALRRDAAAAARRGAARRPRGIPAWRASCAWRCRSARRCPSRSWRSRSSAASPAATTRTAASARSTSGSSGGCCLGIVATLAGDLYAWLSPWGVIVRRVLAPLAGDPGAYGRVPYPAGLGRWPAAAALLGFAWLELVYEPAREPQTLGLLLLAYSVVALVLPLVIGIDAWQRCVDPFGVLAATLSRASATELRALPEEPCEACALAEPEPAPLRIDCASCYRRAEPEAGATSACASPVSACCAAARSGPAGRRSCRRARQRRLRRPLADAALVLAHRRHRGGVPLAQPVELARPGDPRPARP